MVCGEPGHHRARRWIAGIRRTGGGGDDGFCALSAGHRLLWRWTAAGDAQFPRGHLDGLREQLAAAGVRIDPKREDYAYGRFAWIWDPEGNRVELWQAQASE
jgi:hypothetical protein